MSLMTFESEILPVLTELADQEISELVGGGNSPSTYVNASPVTSVTIGLILFSDNSTLIQGTAINGSKVEQKAYIKQQIFKKG